jgi:branched-chain amino acid transport system ATP-binding protein
VSGDEVATPLLSFEEITLRFGGVTAINGVSFTVSPGELFAIIGPNGAGKTSIFNTISQVYRPQIGEIRWKGRSIMGTRPDKVAAMGIARTFQNIELFPGMTVIDNLLTGRHVRMKRSFLAGALWWGPTKKEEIVNRRKVEDIIDFLEIERWRKYPVALLPYGFQKRVELGRALAMEPELLLLDEPVAGMNLEETEDMARFILDIQRELGITMILVEHDMGLVMDIADRVMVLDFGERISLGTPDEVQRDPKVIAAYLGGTASGVDAGADALMAAGAFSGGGGGRDADGSENFGSRAGYRQAAHEEYVAPRPASAANEPAFGNRADGITAEDIEESEA